MQREVRQVGPDFPVEIDQTTFAQLHQRGRGKQLGHRAIQVDRLG